MEITEKMKEIIRSKECVTLGNVIDNMKLDEVAVQVVELNNIPIGFSKTTALYFTKEHNILVSLTNDRPPVVWKDPNEKEAVACFVILSKEEADSLGLERV